MRFLRMLPVLMLSLVAVQGLQAQETQYKFVRIEKLAEQVIGEPVATAIFKSINAPITIEAVPGLRCHELGIAGERDGEMMRIKNYGIKNPQMVMVPTPYYQLNTTVFFKKGKEVAVNSKDDLKKYKVVVVRGVQHTTDITEGLQNVVIVDDGEQMVKFLESERAQVAIGNKIDVQALVKKLKFDDKVVPGTTLVTHDLFLYFAPKYKNQEIVGKVDAAIKKLQASGELAKLVAKSEEGYLQKQ